MKLITEYDACRHRLWSPSSLCLSSRIWDFLLQSFLILPLQHMQVEHVRSRHIGVEEYGVAQTRAGRTALSTSTRALPAPLPNIILQTPPGPSLSFVRYTNESRIDTGRQLTSYDDGGMTQRTSGYHGHVPRRSLRMKQYKLHVANFNISFLSKAH